MRWVFLACLLFWLVVILIAGCAGPAPVHTPVPTWLVPPKPVVPTVPAADLACLSDNVYLRLAARDRACWQHVKELRAVLGAAP